MFIKINRLDVNYQVSGRGEPVLLLHGWGVDMSSFAPVHRHLEQYFTAYSLDFPGFGGSGTPETAWGTKEYMDFVLQFMEKLGIDHPLVLGHSFGGRIGIRLGAAHKVKKLVLIDSAGIKPRRSVKYYVKVSTYKMLKRLVRLPVLSRYGEDLLERWRKKTGSQDYRNASGVVRQIMVKVVNEDLRSLLPEISAPTLLVWGEKDPATPLSDGRLMEKLIPDAGLVVFPHAGHFSYLENLPQFLRIIESFFKEEMEGING